MAGEGRGGEGRVGWEGEVEGREGERWEGKEVVVEKSEKRNENLIYQGLTHTNTDIHWNTYVHIRT